VDTTEAKHTWVVLDAESPSKEPNVPTIVQIVLDPVNHRGSALIPASHYPKTSGRELELQHVDAVWAGPLEVPSVLDKPTVEMVSLGVEEQSI
jgi:hypothetical protein